MCNVYCMSLICSVATDRLSEYCFPTWDSCTVCSRDRCSLLYSCESQCERLLLCRKELHWADASLLKWHHISPFIFPLVLHLTALAVSILKALCGELSQWVHFTGARLWQLGAHELENRTSSRARAFIPPPGEGVLWPGTAAAIIWVAAANSYLCLCCTSCWGAQCCLDLSAPADADD